MRPKSFSIQNIILIKGKPRNKKLMTLISSNVFFFNNIFSLFLSIYFILGFFSLKILMSMIVIIQSAYIFFIHQLFLVKSRKSTIYKVIYRVIVLMLSFSMFLLKLWNENFQPWILIKLYFVIYICIKWFIEFVN